MRADYKPGITPLEENTICSCLRHLAASNRLTNKDWENPHEEWCEMVNTINERKEDTRYFYSSQRWGIHPEPLLYPIEYLPYIEAHIKRCQQEQQAAAKRIATAKRKNQHIEPADYWIEYDNREQLKVLEGERYFESFHQLIFYAQKTDLLIKHGVLKPIVNEPDDASYFAGMTCREIQQQRERNYVAHKVAEEYAVDSLEMYFFHWLNDEKKVNVEENATVRSFFTSDSLIEFLNYRKQRLEQEKKDDEAQKKALNEAWSTNKLGEMQLPYVAIRFFCGMITESEIIPQGDMTVSELCQLICTKYHLPYTDNVRQHFSSTLYFKSDNKYLTKITSIVIPTMEEGERGKLESYITKKTTGSLQKLYS